MLGRKAEREGKVETEGEKKRKGGGEEGIKGEEEGKKEKKKEPEKRQKYKKKEKEKQKEKGKDEKEKKKEEEEEEKGGSVSCHRILDWFPASTSHGRRCHTIKPYISSHTIWFYKLLKQTISIDVFRCDLRACFEIVKNAILSMLTISHIKLYKQI